MSTAAALSSAAPGREASEEASNHPDEPEQQEALPPQLDQSPWALRSSAAAAASPASLRGSYVSETGGAVDAALQALGDDVAAADSPQHPEQLEASAWHDLAESFLSRASAWDPVSVPCPYLPGPARDGLAFLSRTFHPQAGDVEEPDEDVVGPAAAALDAALPPDSSMKQLAGASFTGATVASDSVRSSLAAVEAAAEPRTASPFRAASSTAAAALPKSVFSAVRSPHRLSNSSVGDTLQSPGADSETQGGLHPPGAEPELVAAPAAQSPLHSTSGAAAGSSASPFDQLRRAFQLEDNLYGESTLSDYQQAKAPVEPAEIAPHAVPLAPEAPSRPPTLLAPTSIAVDTAAAAGGPEVYSPAAQVFVRRIQQHLGDLAAESPVAAAAASAAEAEQQAPVGQEAAAEPAPVAPAEDLVQQPQQQQEEEGRSSPLEAASVQEVAPFEATAAAAPVVQEQQQEEEGDFGFKTLSPPPPVPAARPHQPHLSGAGGRPAAPGGVPPDLMRQLQQELAMLRAEVARRQSAGAPAAAASPAATVEVAPPAQAAAPPAAGVDPTAYTSAKLQSFSDSGLSQMPTLNQTYYRMAAPLTTSSEVRMPAHGGLPFPGLLYPVLASCPALLIRGGAVGLPWAPCGRPSPPPPNLRSIMPGGQAIRPPWGRPWLRRRRLRPPPLQSPPSPSRHSVSLRSAARCRRRCRRWPYPPVRPPRAPQRPMGLPAV